MNQMTAQKFESMWKLMRKNNFAINEVINSEYLCTICKRIFIDACSVPCGCRYCTDCITDYLQRERNVCPGTSEDCKENLINIDCDIQRDQAINTRISKLIVKCPNTSCQTKADLKSMENHLESCKYRFIVCPFIKIGCGEDNLSIDKLNEHLSSKIHSHSKLLMEWVNISRNEMELLKIENNDLKEKVANLKIRVRENTTEIYTLGDEMSYLKNQNRSLSGELQEQQTQSEKRNQELNQLRLECQRKEARITVQEKKSQDLEKKLNEISQANFALKSDYVNTIQSIERMRKVIYQPLEFIWEIKNWSEKRQQAQYGTDEEIHSQVFFSHRNGYRMCLSIFPDGDDDGKGTHLSLYYLIKKGPFDNILQWPFKRDVEFTLINQHSGLAHLTYTMKYSDDPDLIESFRKPTGEENIGYGKPQFITLDEISTNLTLSQDDKIFIKCVVRPCS